MSPNKIIVLYQGDCRFCNWCKDLVLRFDTKKVFEFIPIKSIAGVNLIKTQQLIIEPNHPDSIAVLKAGADPKYKWQACITIASESSGFLKLFGWCLKWVPNWLGDWGYVWIGKHRGFMCRLVRCR